MHKNFEVNRLECHVETVEISIREDLLLLFLDICHITLLPELSLDILRLSA